MIPSPIDIGSFWLVLPPGIHDANFADIEKRFVTNSHRKMLFDGLVKGCSSLRDAGCSILYLNGSFITEKDFPEDYDACWDPNGVDSTKLNRVFLDFSNKRVNQKNEFGGEFFISSLPADGSNTFLDYFQNDKHTGKKKGIIRIHLQKNMWRKTR